MARRNHSLPGNTPGPLYVDDACIDCGACTWLAPDSLRTEGGAAIVHSQPQNVEQWLRAARALVTCPTAAIGSAAPAPLEQAIDSLPIEVEEGVRFCGFNSRHTAGACSYLLDSADGPIMVDPPRYLPALMERIEARGGVRRLLLTHRDHFAGARKIWQRFKCEVVVHEGDRFRAAGVPATQLRGSAPIALARDALVLPCPGHTRGSVCLLFRDAVLLSGDHLSWDSARGVFHAHREYCQYDWSRQIDSMRTLLGYPIRTVLPGHGSPRSFAPARMHEEIVRCIHSMRSLA